MRVKQCIKGICIMWPLVYKIKFLLLLPQPTPLRVILNLLIYIFLTLSDVFLYIVSITNPENVCNNSNIGFDGPGHFLAWICKKMPDPNFTQLPRPHWPCCFDFFHMTGHSWAFLTPWNPNLYPWIPAFLSLTLMSRTGKILTLNCDPWINLSFV